MLPCVMELTSFTFVLCNHTCYRLGDDQSEEKCTGRVCESQGFLVMISPLSGRVGFAGGQPGTARLAEPSCFPCFSAFRGSKMQGVARNAFACVSRHSFSYPGGPG